MGIKKKHVPGNTCCGSFCPCSDRASLEYLLTVSNMGNNGNFDQCSNMNGTFTLTYIEIPTVGYGTLWGSIAGCGGPSEICYWESEPFFLDSSEDPGHEVIWALAIIKCSATVWRVIVSLLFINGDSFLQNGHKPYFYNDYGTAPSCSTFSGEVLTSRNTPGLGARCDFTGDADITAA